ncbi:hypothetical protein HanXRQr2_Chr16g0724181 [Helianthus annuus]|uniref:Uncharacterized protein n=1 Tax=Helianthus annuus TaxID=4232 RepID=A0A251RVF6_HELAN|nr:hypothetical protein HanXRQr2_Chr16g0724181 [Helianthus annuus]
MEPFSDCLKMSDHRTFICLFQWNHFRMPDRFPTPIPWSTHTAFYMDHIIWTLKLLQSILSVQVG